jgi:hypothetical protein
LSFSLTLLRLPKDVRILLSLPAEAKLEVAVNDHSKGRRITNIVSASGPPHNLDWHRLEITATAAESRHHRIAILLNRRECHAIFCFEVRRACRTFKDDGRRVSAHPHVDAWIVEMHLNLPRRERSRTL